MTEPVTSRWYKTSNGITAAELLRACGERLTDRELWQKFHARFQKAIFLYVLRILRQRGFQKALTDTAADLAQDVYMRLIQNDGRLLLSFKGNTDRSVMAFLARVAMNVVLHHHQYEVADKRQAGVVVSIEEARQFEGARGDVSELDVVALLSWIDVERLVAADPDPEKGARNVLLLKLHFMEGLTSEEIAEYPGFQLTPSGVNTVLQRLKARLQRGI